MGSDNELAVGFIHVRGDFGKKLYRRDPRRGGEAQLPFNGFADLLGYQGGRPVTMHAVADVKIGFIQRQRLNARGVAGENFADMVRGFFVGIEAAGKQCEMRAQLERCRRRHSAAHAKLARRIVRGTNHATLYPTAAYCEGDIAQRRVVAHLHRRKETVHIDMDNFTHRQTQHCIPIQHSKTRCEFDAFFISSAKKAVKT